MPRSCSTENHVPLVSMGFFDRLPLELRQLVYSESVSLNSIHLLRVNKRFYFEFLEALQRVKMMGTLRLLVDPKCQSSTVPILTGFGYRWGVIDAMSPHLHLPTNTIRTMPVGRFWRINISVYPPNPKDPGQAIRLCKQISAITKSLSACWFPSTKTGIPSRKEDCLFPRQMKKSGNLPCVELFFRQTRRRSWSTNGKLNYSLPDYDKGWWVDGVGWIDREISDVVLVLQSLMDLRQIQGLRMYWHRVPVSGRLMSIFALTKERVELRLELGLGWCREPRCLPGDNCDHRILSYMQSFQVWHDFLLDDLPGPTANILRQQRFLKWCTASERQHDRALRGIPRLLKPEYYYPTDRAGIRASGARDCLDDDLFELIKSSFHSRFWARMACDLTNPKGVERKSQNKLWTEFPERPRAQVNSMEGVHMRDNDWGRSRKWHGCHTRCRLCRVEEDRDGKVLAHRDYETRMDILSANPGDT